MSKMSKNDNQQVRLTGDWSFDSKLSTILNGYWEDPYFKFFNKSSDPKRTSLICRGYYVRLFLCDHFIREILNTVEEPIQFVSIGCGLESTYFKLLPQFENKIINFFDVDFEKVILAKKEIINQNELLKTMADEKLISISADLRKLDDLYKSLKEANFQCDKPTFFYSECVVNYLKPKENDRLLEWISKNVPNCIWFAYEQSFPFDSFGQIMISHFEKNGCAIYSLLDRPDPISQKEQLKQMGFDTSAVINVWDAFEQITKSKNLKSFTKLNSHQFDEYEAFIATCLHYTLRFGFKGKLKSKCLLELIFEDIPEEIPRFSLPIKYFEKFHKIILNEENNNFKIYNTNFRQTCHATMIANLQNAHAPIILTLGGIGQDSQRLHSILKWDKEKGDDNKNINSEILLNDSFFYQRVHSTAVYVEKFSTFYIFGGRKSPQSPCNNLIRLPINFDTNTNSINFGAPSKVSSGINSPKPRFRHSMTLFELSKDNFNILVFGGLSEKEVFNDAWIFDIIKSKWNQIERENFETNYPTPRHSHSSCIDKNKNLIYFVGGMSENGVTLCQDTLWTYNYKNNFWNKIEKDYCVHARRIGHSAQISENGQFLLIVGGYARSSSFSLNQIMSVIDLESEFVTSYELDLGPEKLFLPFGTSVYYNSKDSKILIFGGGGNCFSFGTFYNNLALEIKIPLENI